MKEFQSKLFEKLEVLFNCFENIGIILEICLHSERLIVLIFVKIDLAAFKFLILSSENATPDSERNRNFLNSVESVDAFLCDFLAFVQL